MGRIGEIMTNDPVTISPDCSVRKSVELMERHRIGCLPVLDGKRLVGIITSRDVKRAHPNRLVADAMSKDVITITTDRSFWDAQELLDRHGIERVIVTEDGFPVGIVTKAQLYAELGKQTDALTGLMQAKFLHHKALELLRDGKEICIIFLDLDGFGIIDKELGHVTGDEILRRVARILLNEMDDSRDFLSRYGGDEFAIVSTRRLTEAQEFITLIIDGFAAMTWPQGIRLSASAGIAGGRRNACHAGDLAKVIDDLINMASLASTKAKSNRSSVVVADHAGGVCPTLHVSAANSPECYAACAAEARGATAAGEDHCGQARSEKTS